MSAAQRSQAPRGRLSGFPEWLPDGRIVEQHLIQRLRSTFELHGFASIETRSVEPLDWLLAKGEIDKEIYLLRRLQGDPEESGGTADTPGEGSDRGGLGLHFDLTVPFARYVLEHAGKLQFPFRRYQIQRCWRGERPQEGRYREFTQADIDVIDVDRLDGHYEVELPLVIGEALAVSLPTPDGADPATLPIVIQANNRKLTEGFYRGLEIADRQAALRAVDKLDKIGPDAVRSLLVETAGCSDTQAASCVALAGIATPDTSFVDRVRELGVKDDLLDQGLDELTTVVEQVGSHLPGLLVADLRITRGLDYYTGTVYETQLRGHEQLGSVCSGGRYDSLATDGKTTYPGVGLSIGVSRLLGPLLARGALRASRSVPTCVLVALSDEGSRPACMRVAAALRARGIATEVAPAPVKYGKQIRFADRRGIPYVWFPAGAGTGDDGAAGTHQVRDIRSGEQTPADPDSWRPPAEDLWPVVTGPAGPADTAGGAERR